MSTIAQNLHKTSSKPYFQTTKHPKIIKKHFIPSTPYSSPPSKAPSNRPVGQYGSRPVWQIQWQVSRGLRRLRDLRGLKGRPRCLTSLSDPVKKTHFEAASSKPLLASFEAFEGFEGFEGQVQMSNVAFGSRKKTHFEAAPSKPPLASFEAFEGLRDLRNLRGLKGRPRCLTSLSDPVKKTKQQPRASPFWQVSRLLRRI